MQETAELHSRGDAHAVYTETADSWNARFSEGFLYEEMTRRVHTAQGRRSFWNLYSA
jgi:hypothetical protein